MSSASTSINGALLLYVATKKGAWTLTARADRRQWEIDGPHFLAHIVHHRPFEAGRVHAGLPHPACGGRRSSAALDTTAPWL